MNGNQQKTNSKSEKAVGVTVGDLEEVKLPVLDITPYVGKKVKIANAEVFQTTQLGSVSYYLKVETETIKRVGEGEKAFDLKASRLFGLILMDDGTIGWGDQAKLAGFLKSMNCKKPTDLIGKTVTLQQSEPRPDGRRFLSF
jgi:hypothetical protein